MSAITGPNSSLSGLILSLDAASQRSYVSGSTVWYDVSGNGNNGTLINGPGYSSGNGGAITFDGVNDYVRVLTIGSMSNFTACFWFSVSTFTSEGFFLIASNDTQGMSVRSDLGNKLTWWDGSVAAGIYGVGITTLQANTIYNVTYVRNSTTGIKTIYLNTNTEFSGSIGNTFNNVDFSLGYFPELSRGNFNGKLYSVAIYNRALSAAEIAQNFNSQRFRFGI